MIFGRGMRAMARIPALHWEEALSAQGSSLRDIVCWRPKKPQLHWEGKEREGNEAGRNDRRDRRDERRKKKKNPRFRDPANFHRQPYLSTPLMTAHTPSNLPFSLLKAQTNLHLGSPSPNYTPPYPLPSRSPSISLLSLTRLRTPKIVPTTAPRLPTAI